MRLFRIYEQFSDDLSARTMSEGEFARAVCEVVQDREAMEELGLRHAPSGFVVDLKGRILMDGVHVGWIKRDTPVDEMREFLNALNVAHMPDRHEMAELREIKRSAA